MVTCLRWLGLNFTWRQEESYDDLWVSLKAAGYPRAKHLVHSLQSFEQKPKKFYQG